MGKDRKIIVTTTGLEVPQLKLWERLSAPVLRPVGRCLMFLLADAAGANPQDYPRIEFTFQAEKIMHKIDADFRKGKVEGRLVPNNDPSLKHPTPYDQYIGLSAFNSLARNSH